jgi:hypothetical protein
MMPPHLPPQAPRSSGGASTIVLVFGFIAVVSLLVAGAALFIAFKRTASVATAPVASSAAASTGKLFISTPNGSTPNVPPPDFPSGDAAPGTPAASIRARPAWGRLDHLSPYAKETSQYAPQAEHPEELFRAAKPLVGDLTSAFVVCEMRSNGGHDTFASDDLHMRITLGQTPEIANDGPEDQNTAWLSAPDVALKKGDEVRFELYDRDTFELETITNGSVTYSGGGLAFGNSAGAFECKTIAPAPLGTFVAARTTDAMHTFTALTAHKLEGVSPSWGWPQLGITESEASIGGIAALTGWDAPPAQNAMPKYAAAIDSLMKQRGAIVASLQASAKDEATLGKARAKVTQFSCSGAACGFNVAFTNDGTEPVSLGGFNAGYSFYVASAASGPVAATGGLALLEPIPAGTSKELSLTANAPDLSPPFVVGFCRDNRCVSLKTP